MRDHDIIDFKRLILIIRRQFVFLLLVISLAGGSAAAYVFSAQPLFTAETLLLLDKSFTGAVSDISVMKKLAFEPAAIQSEVEVVRSRRVTSLVLYMLKNRGYFSELDDIEHVNETLVKNLQDHLKVSRTGETYVLNISYTSKDPISAADIANAYAESYITDQLNASSETTKRTFAWLEQKSKEIREQLNSAQENVNRYRLNYNQKKEFERLGKPLSEDQKVYSLNELLNLEKDVENLQELLRSYSEKRDEVNIQTTFPITESRIISYATPPTEQSHPKQLLILGSAIILSAGIGILLALMRDIFDKTLRRAGQVKSELDLAFLGFFPSSRKKSNKLIGFRTSEGEKCAIPMFAQSLESEFSLSAETIRTIKHVIDDKMKNQTTKVIGILSTFPGEGASEISNNLALYTGFTGNKSLFINGNLRKFTKISTQNKVRPSFVGLAGVFLKGKPLREVTLYNERLNVSFLPSLPEESEEVLKALNSQQLKSFINRCQNNFQYIFVDLPPLVASADLYAYAQAIDGFVLVSEWGKSLSNAINFHLQQNLIAKEKILGVVLNRSHMRKLRKFYGHTAYSK